MLFIDEVHRFSKNQQMPCSTRWRTGSCSGGAATTENPSFSVVAPPLSRSLILALQPLDDAEIGTVLDRAIAAPEGLDGAVTLADDARDHLIAVAGEMRRALTTLEAAAGVGAAPGAQSSSSASPTSRPPSTGGGSLRPQR